MNRLANRVLKFAAVAAVCGFAAVGNAAEWTYDSSAKTITTACIGSNGLMSAGGPIDREKSV